MLEPPCYLKTLSNNHYLATINFDFSRQLVDLEIRGV